MNTTPKKLKPILQRINKARKAFRNRSMGALIESKSLDLSLYEKVLKKRPKSYDKLLNANEDMFTPIKDAFFAEYYNHPSVENEFHYAPESWRQNSDLTLKLIENNWTFVWSIKRKITDVRMIEAIVRQQPFGLVNVDARCRSSLKLMRRLIAINPMAANFARGKLLKDSGFHLVDDGSVKVKDHILNYIQIIDERDKLKSEISSKTTTKKPKTFKI